MGPSYNKLFRPLLSELNPVVGDAGDISHIRVENCVGFVKVPLGITGPLLVTGPDLPLGHIFAPLATTEAALVASCSRGCKAFNLCGGLKFEIIGDSMSRAPVFTFETPKEAIDFARFIPNIQEQFAKDAESTSRHLKFQMMTPHIIGSSVHLFISYHCGDASGQNMVTIATQKACDELRESLRGGKHKVKHFMIEGQLASDKKPSWGSVKNCRGVEVITWGSLSNQVCESVLGCTSSSLYTMCNIWKEGGIRNGQFGDNGNTANIIAAIFIATGQDAASVAEASWTHLVPEYDYATKDLKFSLYCPSLPVGTIGGGTGYESQQACLKLMKCAGPGKKGQLAGLIASFALALDISTGAALTNNTFSESHGRLARGVDSLPRPNL
ncbi:substrate-binding domain of hmg-CoA reductase [Penicillium angulare]|uniref:substrate-binding domain of hmg-CoA reductase n=1 Tax=Penicillium angulare TaxID=116970 RepID=UPI002541841D|nr:substrate-binding domain of hmg-CoA reductase [Penicillium angulare]KAJ5291831.1 substrate-binding domain of hmg-CoA reductase [Penicillium angulare]